MMVTDRDTDGTGSPTTPEPLRIRDWPGGTFDMQNYKFEDEALGLSGELYGNCPVQGDAKLRGHHLYFRARGSAWTCAIYLDRTHPAPENFAGSEPFEHDVFFDVDGVTGFVHCGEYGDEFDAGWMPYEEAERFIRTCAAAFVRRMSVGAPPPFNREQDL